MTARLIDWDSAPDIVNSPTVRIWYKQIWSDPWTEDTRLRCDQVSWTIGGNGNSTATLHRDIGTIFHDATRSLETRSEVNLVGYYILIMVAGNDTTEPYNVGGSPAGNYTTPDRFWLGYVESQVLRDDGTTGGVKTGQQTFFCFTLDRALMQTPVIYSDWDNAGTPTTTTALDFNLLNGERYPNKTPASLTFTLSGADFWSTFDIVSYLIERTPGGENGTRVVSFGISGVASLPDYDSPSLQAYGRDLQSLINDLVRPGRMLGWVFRPDITLVNNAPVVGNLNCHFFTLAESQIAIGSETLIANDSQFQINASTDPLTEYTFESNGLETAQQVIVHGAKRITIATLKLGGANPFIEGWTPQEEQTYNEGKSLDVDYPNQDQETQRRWNLEARNAAKLRHVFTRMLLDPDWDGAGVFTTAERQSDIGGNNDNDYQPFLGGIRLLSRLPLIFGKDYSGDPAGQAIQAYGEANSSNDRDPLLLFNAPWDPFVTVDAAVLGKAAHLQGSRDGDDADFSVGISILGDDRSFQFVISGGEAHEIAYSKFVRLPADPEDQALSKYDYSVEGKVTIAIEEDRYLEVREPKEFTRSENATAYDELAAYVVDDEVNIDGRVYKCIQDTANPAGPFNAAFWQVEFITYDALRQKLIRAGETYQSIFVAADTVTDVAADGSEVVLQKGFLVDDYEKLEKIAKLAAAWYTTNRNELRMTTARISGEILPGSLITSVSGKAVNTVVSSVTIDLPPGGSASMATTTWYGDIDPVGLLQDAGVV